jgi:hypothetical protein
MGQYHITVNLDKKEFLNPHRIGDGLKLWEQGASQGGTLNALHALLAVSNGRGGGDYIDGHEDFVGRWGGDRIAIVGGYAEDDDLPTGDARSIYNTPAGWTDISDLACDFLEAQWGVTFDGGGWARRTVAAGSPFYHGEE